MANPGELMSGLKFLGVSAKFRPYDVKRVAAHRQG